MNLDLVGCESGAENGERVKGARQNIPSTSFGQLRCNYFPGSGIMPCQKTPISSSICFFDSTPRVSHA